MAATPYLVVVGTLAAAAGAVALGLGSGEDDERATLAMSAGAVRIANSREGHAVLAARGLDPGHSAEGTVTISNTGDAPGRRSPRAL